MACGQSLLTRQNQRNSGTGGTGNIFQVEDHHALKKIPSTVLGKEGGSNGHRLGGSFFAESLSIFSTVGRGIFNSSAIWLALRPCLRSSSTAFLRCSMATDSGITIFKRSWQMGSSYRHIRLRRPSYQYSASRPVVRSHRITSRCHSNAHALITIPILAGSRRPKATMAVPSANVILMLVFNPRSG